METFEEVCELLKRENYRLSSLYENCRGDDALCWGAAVASGRYHDETVTYGHGFGSTPSNAILKALEICKEKKHSPYNKPLFSNNTLEELGRKFGWGL